MGQYLGLWEWLRGRSHLGVMESLVMESLGGLESLDRRSLDDLESRLTWKVLKVCGRFGLAIRQSPEWFRRFARVGLTTVNVCSKQQIVNLGVTLSGAEAGLLLRMN